MRFTVCSAALVSIVGCGTTSSVTPLDSGGDHDVAAAVDSGDVGTAVSPDTSLDTALDVAPDDADVGIDAPASKCAPADLFVPPNKDASAIKLLSFGGYLWIASSTGLFRVPFTGGALTKVGSFWGLPEVFPHGSELLVVDGFTLNSVDPATLAITSLGRLEGTFSSYSPRTALAGDSLFVLRNDPSNPAGTELGRFSLTDKTWTSLWTGPKADGLHRARDRVLVFGFRMLVTVSDPGSGAPAITLPDSTNARPLATDTTGSYFRVEGPSGSDLFSVAHGADTFVALGATTEWAGPFERMASDDTRVLHVFANFDKELHTFVLRGGVWTALPCIAAGGSVAHAATIAGDHAYVAVSSDSVSFADAILRIKLP